jgi:hypothetical protein
MPFILTSVANNFLPWYEQAVECNEGNSIHSRVLTASLLAKVCCICGKGA